MHYFTKELWLKINDQNEAVRTQAEKEWETNGLLYQQQFEKVKKRLSRRFLKDFLLRKGLHDYVILGIKMAKHVKEYSCELQLSNGTETVLVTMYGLNLLKINIDSFQNCILGELMWGYSEFEITPENNVQMAVLCDPENEMIFQFKSIKLTKG